MSAAKRTSSVFATEKKAYLKLCEGVNTPRSLTCWILASNDQWLDLLKLENHFDDQNVPHSADDYLVTSIMKKNPRLPIEGNPEQVALEKFLECEEHVKSTNRKIRRGELFTDVHPDSARVIKKARKIIAKILGRLTTTELDQAYDVARFGNGSTFTCRGKDVSSSRKYRMLSATPGLSACLKRLLPKVWWEAAGTLVMPEQWYSSLITVPKNALTDRPIEIQPHLNIWMQLGVGGLIRKKLRNFGLDLDTQAEWNRFLASQAQTWGLCTIDLESASDTIAEELVRYMLPIRWLHLLELCRTDKVQMPDGTIIGLEKWSAMGNGYTFELESLIFYALALAASENKAHTSVFGDDIIVPQSCSSVLLDALDICGFRVNRSKTFLVGSFFESCGTDWLNGINIRPFYFKAEVKDKHDQTDAYIKYANQIRLYAHSRKLYEGKSGCDKRLLPSWLVFHGSVSAGWRNCRIPAGYGDDSGFISNFDEAAPAYDRTFGDYKFQMRYRGSLSMNPVKDHGWLLSHLKSRPTGSRHTLCRGIGLFDYISKEPDVSIRLWRGKQTSRSTNSSPVASACLRFLYAKRTIDFRGEKAGPQHTVGRVTEWPSLGPWM